VTLRGDRRAWWVVLAALPVVGYGLGWGVDRDVTIAAGDRILRGDWPHRDYWTIYAPGGALAVAATFAVLGRELIAVHAVAVAAAALACGAFYRLLVAVGVRARAGLVATAVFALAIWTPSPPLDSYAFARLLLLLGLERVVAVLRGGGPRVALVAGLVFGSLAWFKHDVAAYAAAGSALAVGFARLPGASRVLGRFAVGCALPVVPGMVWLAWLGGAAAWHDLIVFPASDFVAVRAEPFPALLPPLRTWLASLGGPLEPRAVGHAALAFATWGQAVLPALLFALWGAQALARRHAPALEWLPVACLPFFWAAAHVQQNTHLASMGILSALLAALWWPRERLPLLRGALAALLALLAASFLAGSGVQFARMQLEQRSARPLELPGTAGVRVPAQQAAAYQAIVSRVRRETSRDEPLYVALARHDAVVIGDPSFYFLADRPAATAYHELHPGVVDRLEVQRQIIDALEAQRVRFVVRWRFGWPDERLDAILAHRQRHLPELGARELDDYLRDHFEEVVRSGEYDLLRRRESP